MNFEEVLYRAQTGDKEAVLQILEMFRPLLIKNSQYVGDVILQYGRHDVCGKDQYAVDGSGRYCLFGDGNYSGVWVFLWTRIGQLYFQKTGRTEF